MTPSRIIPCVEGLEDRYVLSALIAPPTPVHHALAGVGHGDVSRNWTIMDVGSSFTLKGTAQVADLGQVTVTGSVHGVGFAWSGHAGGTLTFSNPKGSVKVNLEGPLQGGFSSLPRYFHYQISSGTGAYGKLTDQGTMLLSVNIPWYSGHGTFALAV
jgi:hypothetical protein